MPETAEASFTRKRARATGSRSRARAVRRSIRKSSRPGASVRSSAGCTLRGACVVSDATRRAGRIGGEIPSADRHARRRGHERQPLGHESPAPAQEAVARALEDGQQSLLEPLVAHELADHDVELAAQPHAARLRAQHAHAVGHARLAREGLDHRHQHGLALDRDHAPRAEPRGEHRPHAAARAEVEDARALAHARPERAGEGAVAPRVAEQQLLVRERALRAARAWDARDRPRVRPASRRA